MDILISVSTDAGTKFNNLTSDTRKEVDRLVDDLILTMPIEPTDSPAWPISERRGREVSPSGSTSDLLAGSKVRRRKGASLLLILFLTFSPNISRAAEGLVNDKYLRAVMLVESGGRNVTGDNGRALGYYQFWATAWRHASNLRREANLPVLPYRTGAADLLASKTHAQILLQWHEKQLKRNGCTHPTPGQLYASWNLGHAGFKRRGYDLARCPAITRRAVIKLNKHLK
jgi:hypothetical protein